MAVDGEVMKFYGLYSFTPRQGFDEIHRSICKFEIDFIKNHLNDALQISKYFSDHEVLLLSKRFSIDEFLFHGIEYFESIIDC